MGGELGLFGMHQKSSSIIESGSVAGSWFRLNLRVCCRKFATGGLHGRGIPVERLLGRFDRYSPPSRILGSLGISVSPTTTLADDLGRHVLSLAVSILLLLARYLSHSDSNAFDSSSSTVRTLSSLPIRISYVPSLAYQRGLLSYASSGTSWRFSLFRSLTHRNLLQQPSSASLDAVVSNCLVLPYTSGLSDDSVWRNGDKEHSRPSSIAHCTADQHEAQSSSIKLNQAFKPYPSVRMSKGIIYFV